jgi:hypothetical protein
MRPGPYSPRELPGRQRRVEVNQDIEAEAPADEDIAGEVVEQVIEKTDIDRA